MDDNHDGFMENNSGRNEIKEYIASHLISIRELQAREPTRVTFKEMPGASGAVARTEFEAFPLGVFTVRDMALVGAYGIITTLQKDVLREQNAHTVVENAYIITPRPCEASTPNFPSLISLVAEPSYCFYHWMLDSLPKVIVAEACGFKGIYLVPPDVMIPWVPESMEMLGIPPERYHPMKYTMVSTDELWIPTHIYGWRLGEIPILQKLFRSNMLRASRGHATSNPSRLFIPRKPPLETRLLVNYEETIKVLAKFGFAEAQMEGFTIRQQIDMVSKVRAMVGPHGAGMLHALFMPENSLVIEFFAPDYINYTIYSILQLLRHRYIPLLPQVIHPYAYGKNIEVDCRMLETILEKELG